MACKWRPSRPKGRYRNDKPDNDAENYIFDSPNMSAMMKTVDVKAPNTIPYTVLVKPDGKIICRRIGLTVPLELKRAIVEYLVRYSFKP